MRVVFMGSPEFALRCLEGLYAQYTIAGVITQPDRLAGRGRGLRPSAVKVFAMEKALPLFQPDKLAHPDSIHQILQWKPDLIVVAAYGQILPEDILELPAHGSLNVHASLLPRWRGAAPVQAAILAGDDFTGITIMRMDAGMDTGPILSQRQTEIKADETGGELVARLARLGTALLLETIPQYVHGFLEAQPQDNSSATYAPLLKKSDGELAFAQTAAYLARQVRAFEPWPGSFFIWEKDRIVVRKASAQQALQVVAGRVSEHAGYPAIGTADGLLVLELVQPAGRKTMGGDSFLRGARDFVGAQLH